MSRGDIQAGRAFVELFVKNNAFMRGMRDMRRDLANAGKDIQAIGQKLAGIGVAIGAPLAAAVKRFADFDDAMRSVGAVTQSTDAGLRSMTETASRLGATTSFTAVQVASLMTELGRAGFSPDQINEMTGAVLNLARATGTDAALSAGIMSATMRQFGLDASQAARVSDAFTAAANKSFNTVEQLGEAMSYAGPVAADMGMSLEETLAIFGGLGNVGIQASNAGTAVRRLLTMTAADASKMREIFGVEFVDAAGNARPLIDVLEEVNVATADMGSAERAAKFNEAFGLLGITAASAIGKSVGSVRELRDALVGAAGTADETAKKMDAGLGGSFRILLSAVEGVAIAIGESLAPAIKGLADRASEIAGQIKAWVEQNREAIITAAKVAAGLVAAGAAFIGVGMALQLVAGAIGGFVGMAAALGTVLAAITSPIGLAVAGFAALAAGFIKVSGAGSYVTAQFKTLWEAMKGISGLLMAGDFSQAWEAAKLAMLALGSAVLDMASQAPEFVGYALGRTTRAIVDGLGKLVSWMGSTLGKLFTALLSQAASFGPKLITAMITGNWSGLSDGITKALLDAVGDAASAFGEGWNKKGAPSFQASGRTQDLRRQMATAMQVRRRGPAGTPQEIDLSAPGSTAAAAGGGAGGLAAAALAKPTLDLTDLEKYRERLMELTAARRANVISEAEFRTGLSQLKTQLLSVTSPMDEYRERVRLLQAALADGTISAAEFRREVAEALPDKVKRIIDNAKTPLEKFNEQIAEARDFFRRGLITREQFAVEQERLQEELRGTSDRMSQRVSVSFSGAGLMALGAGGGSPQDRMADDVRRSARAAEEQKALAARQLEETQGLRQDLGQVMPFRWR